MEINIFGKIMVFIKERCLVYIDPNVTLDKMFTVHSREVFTQDKSSDFSNISSICANLNLEKLFTIKSCSLIRGVHYERSHCIHMTT